MSTIDVTEHFGLVEWSARRCKTAIWACKGACTGYDDVIQAGRMGLMRAAEKFDDSRGVQFATYARWWIDAYIKDLCFNKLRAVRIPRNVALKRWKAGTPVAMHATSIDTGFTDRENGGDSHMLDYLGFHSHQEDEQMDTDHLHARLRSAIRGLPKREAAVLHGRFFDGLTLAQLGAEFGVSRERIRQLEAKALNKLRQHFQVDRAEA